MICEALSDQMPAVARGDVVWDAEEALHFAQCAECRDEYALVAAVLSSARPAPVLDLDRIAAAVSAVGREEGKVVAIASRRRTWTRGLVGLAAAAGIALVAYSIRTDDPVAVAAVPARTTTAIPELDALLEDELKIVLASLTEEQKTLTPGPIPRLGELTEAELDALLDDVEG